MATGVTVGYQKYSEPWNYRLDRLDGINTRPALVSANMSPASEPVGHHRSYSEVQHRPDRPRLPPISNFLNRTDRHDFDVQSNYHSSSLRSPFDHSTTPTTQLTISSPIRQQPWTSINTSHKQASYFESTSTSPSGEITAPELSGHDYRRRASVAVPPSNHIGNRAALAYPSVLPNHREALSAHVPVTAKIMVGEDVVDGKECYVYDDGTCVPKSINGDTVNPKWGTTKAGKPRKRLGQACNTCREKKIKCDPSSQSKCTQCEKFGRECIFEAPSRQGHRSPRSQHSGSSPTASYARDDMVTIRRSSAAPTETSMQSETARVPTPKTTQTPDSLKIHRLSDATSDSHSPTPTKRARMTYEHSTAKLPFSIAVDPFMADSTLTNLYLDAYFANVNTSTFGLLPSSLFMRWVEKDQEKCPVSRLVVYCMLVIGCRFAKHPDVANHEKLFAQIAQEGIMQPVAKFSLELVHARLIYALYEFQMGREQAGWDICGAAMRAACAMSLNTEDGIVQACYDQKSVYGLEQGRLAECMRRTFWIAFILDRFSTASMNFPTTFDKGNLFLRLPCADSGYLSGLIPETQIFDGEEGTVLSMSSDQLSRLCSLAFLAQISFLSCEIHVLATRAKTQTTPQREKQCSNLRSSLTLQLQTWEQDYSTYLQLNGSVVSHTGPAPFIVGGLHMVYHHTCMVLHRYVRHSTLTQREVMHHAQEAHRHAYRTLEIAQQLDSKNAWEIPDYNIGATGALAGYAIVAAIDIVTAAGLNSDLLENDGRLMRLMMNGAVPLLDRLAQHWTSAKKQGELVLTRTKTLYSTLMSGMLDRKGAFYVTEPMIQGFHREGDLIYGVDRLQYFKAMGWGTGVESQSDLIEVRVKNE